MMQIFWLARRSRSPRVVGTKNTVDNQSRGCTVGVETMKVQVREDLVLGVDRLVPGALHLSELPARQSRSRRCGRVKCDRTTQIPQIHAAVEPLKQTVVAQMQKAFNYNTQALSGHLQTQAKSTCGGKRPQSRVRQRKEENGVTKSKTQADLNHHQCIPSAVRNFHGEDAWTVDAKPLA